MTKTPHKYIFTLKQKRMLAVAHVDEPQTTEDFKGPLITKRHLETILRTFYGRND